LPAVERIARQAGEVILDVYRGDFTVREKADASPVTQADERAEASIVPALQVLSPHFPVVAEEAASRGESPVVDQSCWMVDPLDGTREFVARSGEFTVNIGLVVQGVPLLGVVFVPVHDTLYAGIAGLGAWVERRGQRLAISCRRVPLEGATLATSRWHGSDSALHDWLQDKPVAARITAGSSLKFGLLAEGRADLYPRFGRTMEWDTAAGDALLTAAGGQVVDLQGRSLRYAKPGFENPDFVAHGLG
ncbi:MAG TPA: 3'(2'),5'-bisphosphate nucleotidase CysQ, partial [Rubrivivax sp.]|nr:3'(2'),5'-bisphosphate nucleotidase CysQ [Rubrivivax sp.]